MLADQTRTLIEDTKNYGQNPNDPEKRDKVMETTKILKEMTICLAEEVKERKQMKKLTGSANEAILATQQMIEKAKESNVHNTNEASRTQLAKDIKSMEKRIDNLQKSMNAALADPDDSKVNAALMKNIQDFAVRVKSYIGRSSISKLLPFQTFHICNNSQHKTKTNSEHSKNAEYYNYKEKIPPLYRGKRGFHFALIDR